ncbi:MAG: DUF72 domain-containing protein [Alphaproteobacteria bacterium]|nr:DUF72 domain-containing protein [Alphaproteobacteria bacterium]
MIRVGIGGWKYAPWRETFYPKEVTQAQELSFASRAVTAIEINSTFYRAQRASVFKSWANQTPDDFVFTLKAPRYATHRRILSEAKSSIERFAASGITALEQKLGPILWQFHPSKRFDPADFENFFSLLPEKQDGIALRHAIEVRHESFAVPEFAALARKAGAAIVYSDSAKYPLIEETTAGFSYARLQRSRATVKTGYTSAELKTVAAWARNREKITLGKRPAGPKRDVFIFMINGAKERAPGAALALLKLLT